MDVFDPYEERGVPNPHGDYEPPYEQPFVAANTSHSNVPTPDVSATERKKIAARRRARMRKRIRPGFYLGSEPVDES